MVDLSSSLCNKLPEGRLYTHPKSASFWGLYSCRSKQFFRNPGQRRAMPSFRQAQLLVLGCGEVEGLTEK